MKKTNFVILLVVIAVLLGLAVYSTLFFYGNSALLPCCPLLTIQTEANLFEIGSSRDFRMMNPGMINAMQVNIESELDFLIHMIPHHQEAVATAKFLRDNSKRPEMKRFAVDIIETQSAEIEQMIGWLEIWYLNEQHSVDYQPMMRNLENLGSSDLERTFLEDMIPHHMTAVMMSQQLLTLGLAEHQQVAVLARNIRDSQRNEIHLMRRWLSLWYNNVSKAADRRLPGLNMGLILLLFLVFIVLVVLLLILLFSTNKYQGFTPPDNREILDKRYVKGEISRKDYLNRRNLK